jgi:monoamine oxidase
VDVIVVGAGLSGLAAARRLVRSGASVAVLEARSRVGGRTYTVNRERTFIDVGGQFIGPSQHRIIALANALGVKSFKPFNRGESLLDYNGKIARWTKVPPLPSADLIELGLAEGALDEMAKKVPVAAPYDAPNAIEWDWQTYASWLDENVSSAGARMLLTLEFLGNAVEPGEASLLTVLRGRISSPHGENPETSRFVGGAQQISVRAARTLGRRVVPGRCRAVVEALGWRRRRG